MPESERKPRQRDPGDGPRLRKMNEALIQSSIHQQELTEEAERSATALRRNQAELREELADMDLLRALSAEVQGNVAVLYEMIVDTAAALMHADFASMQIFHPDRGEAGELLLVAYRGFTPEAARSWEWVSASDGTTCGAALASGLRTVVPNIEACEFIADTVALVAYRQTGIRSVQSTPLISRGGKRIGMLSTHWRRVHEPSERELHLFDLLARQAADVVDRRHVEEALRLSDEETRRLLELVRRTTTSMGEGLYTVDVEGRATSVNPEAERLLGWEPGALIGRVMHDVMHYKRADGSPFPAGECAALQVLRTGQAVKDCEDTFIKKDGTSLPVSFSSSPLCDDDGAVVGIVVVFQDISERKRARQELKQAVEDLASMNQRKDEFLAMLSHELRNPLAPIRTAVHLMRTQGGGGENSVEQQARDIIERQVGNLTKIVSDLLEVSRVVSGRIRLDMQAVDLNRVASHAVEATQHLVEQRKHALSLELCPDPVWVNGDVTRLEEVLVNLLNNAAKYTPDGGHIEVRCERPAGSEYAELRVRDDGEGIEEELLRGGRIFDLFTQADRSLARSAGGLGIGLSLAQKLVGLHGGSIAVQSPPDGSVKGSEFVVRLPLAPPPAMAAVEEPGALPPNPAGMRVLVVEDNLDLVRMLSLSLRHAGYSVQCASSGPEGLRAAQEWRPDVVLLDIGLPGLDGYEVARRLRQDPVLSKMRLVAMTGYGRETDLALAREAGFDTHLTKPVEFERLEKVLIEAAQASPTRRRR